MAVSYKTSQMRGPSAISQAGAGKRIESPDGGRWAISANRKRALAGRRYDSVEVWTLKRRGPDGRTMTAEINRDEAAAREWVKGTDMKTTVIKDGPGTVSDRRARLHRALDSAIDRKAAKDADGEYEVVWTDRAYKTQRKAFKNDPQGAPGNGESKACAFAKRLEEMDRSSKYGDIRGGVRVQAKDQFALDRKRASDASDWTRIDKGEWRSNSGATLTANQPEQGRWVVRVPKKSGNVSKSFNSFAVARAWADVKADEKKAKDQYAPPPPPKPPVAVHMPALPVAAKIDPAKSVTVKLGTPVTAAKVPEARPVRLGTAKDERPDKALLQKKMDKLAQRISDLRRAGKQKEADNLMAELREVIQLANTERGKDAVEYHFAKRPVARPTLSILKKDDLAKMTGKAKDFMPHPFAAGKGGKCVQCDYAASNPEAHTNSSQHGGPAFSKAKDAGWDPATVGTWSGRGDLFEYSKGGFVEKTAKGQWIGYGRGAKTSQAFISKDSAMAWTEHEFGARFAKAKDALAHVGDHEPNAYVWASALFNRPQKELRNKSIAELRRMGEAALERAVENAGTGGRLERADYLQRFLKFLDSGQAKDAPRTV